MYHLCLYNFVFLVSFDWKYSVVSYNAKQFPSGHLLMYAPGKSPQIFVFSDWPCIALSKGLEEHNLRILMGLGREARFVRHASNNHSTPWMQQANSILQLTKTYDEGKRKFESKPHNVNTVRENFLLFSFQKAFGVED